MNHYSKNTSSDRYF